MKLDKARYITSLMPSLFFLICIWGIKGLELLLDVRFHQLGIYPLKWENISGVITAPLIHGSWDHLSSNSLPLLVLGTALFFFYRKIAYEVLAIIYIVSGIWVWLFASPGYHLGASGLIYGIAFFLFFSGILRKNKETMALSLLVVVLYGSIVWGLLPYDPKISWQTHLFAAIIGVILAFYHARAHLLNRKRFVPRNNTNSTIDFVDDTGTAIDVIYTYKSKEK